MGGGTGSGGAPVVAELAKALASLGSSPAAAQMSHVLSLMTTLSQTKEAENQASLSAIPGGAVAEVGTQPKGTPAQQQGTAAESQEAEAVVEDSGSESE